MISIDLQTIGTVAALVVGATFGWIRYSTSCWNSALTKFHQENHGYCTTNSRKKQVLLIVCPASGGGKAMRLYPECLHALERRRGLEVEVYVTCSAEDLIALSETVDLYQYSEMIAVLSGDSSIYEMIQSTMARTNGNWPFVPILVLPGGSSNAMSFEFHGSNTLNSISDLIQHATVVRKASVIKCTSSSHDATPARSAIHVAFDGWQRTVIQAIESYRSNLYVAFGKLPVLVMAFGHLLVLPLKRNKPCPNVLTVLVSDREGSGLNLNFGVDRFDENMIVIYQSKYCGLVNLIKIIGKEMSGKLGQDYREGKAMMIDEGLIVKVTSESYTVSGDGEYTILFDGTSMLPLKGESITFQVVKDAIPYLVSDEMHRFGRHMLEVKHHLARAGTTV